MRSLGDNKWISSALIQRLVVPQRMPSDIMRPAGAPARVLVFLCGLLGNYQLGLETLRNTLFEPNRLTVQFECALLTSRRLLCSMKELAEERCSCEPDDATRAVEEAERILMQSQCKLVYSDIRDNGQKQCVLGEEPTHATAETLHLVESRPFVF